MCDSLIHNGKVWVAQVDLGTNPDGSRRRRKKHLRFDSDAAGEREARKAMLDWLATISPDRCGDGSTTVEALLERWIDSKRSDWSAAHLDGSERSAAKIAARIGTRPVNSLRRRDIEAL